MHAVELRCVTFVPTHSVQLASCVTQPRSALSSPSMHASLRRPSLVSSSPGASSTGSGSSAGGGASSLAAPGALGGERGSGLLTAAFDASVATASVAAAAGTRAGEEGAGEADESGEAGEEEDGAGEAGAGEATPEALGSAGLSAGIHDMRPL